MWRKDVEIILARQLASYLAMPIFIVDPEGDLLYYNEPAEVLLGRRFAETGMMTADGWAQIFTPTDEAGHPVPPDGLPLMVALSEQRPAMGSMWIRALDDAPHYLEVLAFPLEGLAGKFLGAVALFWKVD